MAVFFDKKSTKCTKEALNSEQLILRAVQYLWCGVCGVMLGPYLCFLCVNLLRLLLRLLRRRARTQIKKIDSSACN